MAERRRIISYDDFSAGEYGLLGGTLAPKGSFTGTNVVRLLDGSLAPRSGLVRVSPTGLPTGNMAGFGFNAGQQKCWFVSGTAVHQFATTSLTPASTSVGTLASTPTKRIRGLAQRGTLTYLSNYGDKSYGLDHSGASLSALTGSPGGRLSTVYGDRLVVASTSAQSRRVAASAPESFSTWPTTNFVDVGAAGYSIGVLAAHRGRLTLAREDGTWWALEGIIGVNHRWHRLFEGLRAGGADNAVSRWARTAGENVCLVPDYGEYPAFLSGQGIQRFEHLSLTNLGETYTDSGLVPKVGVTGLTKAEDAFIATGGASSSFDDRGLLFHRGLWTRHDFDVAISGHVDGAEDPQQRIFFSDGASSPKFYAWAYDLNRPPKSGDTWESLGDNSSTPPPASFTLPEHWARDQEELAVRAVIVDFKKWAHGYGDDNAFTVTVNPLRLLGSGDGDTTSQSWSEDETLASSTGTQDRESFSFLPVFGNGMAITISGLVGVAIQRVHVVLDTRPVQV